MESTLTTQSSFTEDKQGTPGAPSEEKQTPFKQDVESTAPSDLSDVLHSERDLVTHVISVIDDPSLNPWTIRAFLIGLGLSTFGGILGSLNLSN